MTLKKYEKRKGPSGSSLTKFLPWMGYIINVRNLGGIIN